jgi:ribosomal protein S4E
MSSVKLVRLYNEETIIDLTKIVNINLLSKNEIQFNFEKGVSECVKFDSKEEAETEMLNIQLHLNKYYSMKLGLNN